MNAEQQAGELQARAAEQRALAEAPALRQTTVDAQTAQQQAEQNAVAIQGELDRARARLQEIENQIRAAGDVGGGLQLQAAGAPQQVPVKVVPPASSMQVALNVPATSIRLVSALNQAGVSAPFQQALFAAGVVTLNDFASLGTGTDAHDQLRAFLADIGIDPAAETQPLVSSSTVKPSSSICVRLSR